MPVPDAWEHVPQATRGLWVDTGKSRRLLELSVRSSALLYTDAPEVNIQGTKQSTLSEADVQIRQARLMIGARIKEITRLFPDGKKGTLFKIRYGHSIDDVKNMAIEDAFNLLGIDSGQNARPTFLNGTRNGKVKKPEMP